MNIIIPISQIRKWILEGSQSHATSKYQDQNPKSGLSNSKVVNYIYCTVLNTKQESHKFLLN